MPSESPVPPPPPPNPQDASVRATVPIATIAPARVVLFMVPPSGRRPTHPSWVVVGRPSRRQSTSPPSRGSRVSGKLVHRPDKPRSAIDRKRSRKRGDESATTSSKSLSAPLRPPRPMPGPAQRRSRAHGAPPRDSRTARHDRHPTTGGPLRPRRSCCCTTTGPCRLRPLGTLDPMPRDAPGRLVAGRVCARRDVPASIPRPEYVGPPGPRPFTGSDVYTPDEIERIRTSGRIAAQAVDAVRAAIRPGVTTEELDVIAHDHLVA